MHQRLEYPILLLAIKLLHVSPVASYDIYQSPGRFRQPKAKGYPSMMLLCLALGMVLVLMYMSSYTILKMDTYVIFGVMFNLVVC